MEQELFTPAGAPAFTPDFSGVRVTRYYRFICMFVPFLLFLLTILLSVLLRFTDSVYPVVSSSLRTLIMLEG